MLTTLKKFDRVTRNGILANYAQEILPNPGFDENPSNLPDDLKQHMHAEIAKILRLGNDHGPEARNKILTLLYREMQDGSVDAKKIKAVRDRVGQKGVLLTPHYDIVFSQAFSQFNETMGISRSLITSAFLSHANSVEHLLPEVFGLDNVAATTVLTKTYGGADPYTIIVLAGREKSKLTVDQAWLAYHSEVNMEKVHSPLDALRAFIEKYGCLIRVGDTTGKFIFYEKLFSGPFLPSVNVFQCLQTEIKVQDGRFVHKISPGGLLEVAIAFSLDTLRYGNDLKRHGRKITRDIFG